MLETLQNEENGGILTEKGFGLLYVMFKNLFSKPRSLRTTLAQRNALVLLLALLLLDVIVYQAVTYRMVTDLDNRLHTQGIQLENATRQWVPTGTSADFAFFNQLVRVDRISEFTTNSLSIKIFDKQTRRILALSLFLNQVLVPFNQSAFVAALHGQHVFNILEDSAGNEVHTLTFPLYDKLQQLVAIAQVSQSLQMVRQVQALLVGVLGIGGLIAVIMAYAVSFLLTNYELHPLSTLINTMHRSSAQRLQTRLSPQKSDTIEIQKLTEAFNSMMDRIEASFDLQRSFVTNVSHELRTPLTALQGHIDVLLLDPNLDGIRPDLYQINAELRRLSRMVANLLTTARVDAGMLPQPFANGIRYVELDLLLVEVARQAHFLNQQEKIEIGHFEQICVPGDTDMLKQVLLNLVDNAITYTPLTGRVTLSLTRSTKPPEQLQTEAGSNQGEWAILSVCDTGPGIHPEDLPHIFERHYRARHAEGLSTHGIGLGLSIAHLIVEAHHGYVNVESELGKGTCFHVWLAAVRETTSS
jgi:signal transduction histidine kinase